LIAERWPQAIVDLLGLIRGEVHEILPAAMKESGRPIHRAI
jgi:hypothetical protein